MAELNYKVGGVPQLPIKAIAPIKPITPFMANLNPGNKPLTSFLNEGAPSVATDPIFGKYTDPNFKLGQPDLTANFGETSSAPKLGGEWMDGAKIGLGAAEVGLGVWNALEQSKMNKFMRGYYGNQMDLQRTDFGNAAKSTNAAIAQREQNKLSAQGHAFDSAENKAGVTAAMNQWGVKETF